MTEAFDPYRKWLGIPEQDQPPHCYRLLGIELFESDQDVISNAADGRMAQVKNFQSGKHSAVSQRILNEIAAAKVRLLNPQKKAEYDQRLRQRLAAKPGPVGKPGGKPKRKKDLRWLPAAAAGSVLLVGGLIAAVMHFSDGAPVEETRKADPAANGTVKQTGQPEVAKPKPLPPKRHPENDPSNPGTVVVPKPEKPLPRPKEKMPIDNGPDKPHPEKPVPPKPDVPPEKPPKEKVEPKPKPEVKEQPEEKPVVNKRLPVPDEARQDAKANEIKEKYADEFAAARSAETRAKLAAKLAQAAATVDDPAERFAFLRLARGGYTAAGDFEKAMEVVDRMAEQYQMNGLETKTELLEMLSKDRRQSAAHAPQLATAALAVIASAVTEDDFETAARLMGVARQSAAKAKDTQLKADVAARGKELAGLKRKYAGVQKALEALAKDPADGAANLEAGQWYGLTQGKWDKALPLLAKGSDADLAKLAQRDLGGPKDPTEKMKLADDWWARAEKEKDPAKALIHVRAAHWYAAALPGLKTDLERDRAATRIKSAGKAALPSHGTIPGGIIVPGNVALAGNGTTVTGVGTNAAALLDGDTSDPGNGMKVAISEIPSKWTITFNKPYRLKELRFLPENHIPREHQYQVLVSRDGKDFEMVADRSKGKCVGWQFIELPKPRPVKAVQLIGLFNSTGKNFCVVEFEAYCDPPPPRPKNPVAPKKL